MLTRKWKHYSHTNPQHTPLNIHIHTHAHYKLTISPTHLRLCTHHTWHIYSYTHRHTHTYARTHTHTHITCSDNHQPAHPPTYSCIHPRLHSLPPCAPPALAYDDACARTGVHGVHALLIFRRWDWMLGRQWLERHRSLSSRKYLHPPQVNTLSHIHIHHTQAHTQPPPTHTHAVLRVLSFSPPPPPSPVHTVCAAPNFLTSTDYFLDHFILFLPTPLPTLISINSSHHRLPAGEALHPWWLTHAPATKAPLAFL